MSDPVTVSIANGVADVRLNRPAKYNSLTAEMIKAIVATGEEMSQNHSVRAVVLSGNGPGFCAGMDMQTFKDIETKGKDVFESTGKAFPNYFQRAAYVWKQLSVPVIAALHGVTYGGGLQIALCADIRLAGPDVRLSVMEIRWGVIPDMSGCQTLRDLVRLDVAKELFFSGRIVEAQEAERLGLITRICSDPVAEALAMANEIANKSPEAIIAGKRLLEAGWHGNSLEGLMLEERLQKSLIGSPNQLEAVKANFEKRQPEFQDPADINGVWP